MRRNKSILLLALACCVVVSAPTYSIAAPPVTDPAPTNFVEFMGYYDYRDYGVVNPAVVGAYFTVYAGIVVGNFLSDYTNVLSVTATHQQTGFELNLVSDDPCTNFLGRPEKFWSLFLKPASWMLTGTWEFTLTYNGSDGKRHKQVKSWSMGQTAFPVKPTYIQVNKESGYFTVSWSGIGNSCPSDVSARYRIRVYGDNFCAIQEYRAPCDSCVFYPNCELGGTYDPTSNRVTFHVPLEYEGYVLRLENYSFIGSQLSRASQYIVLF